MALIKAVSPLRFVAVFNEVVSERAASIRDNWWKQREYTQLILGRPNGVLHEVAGRLGLADWGGEFLRMDAAYTTDVGSRQFLVVVEHENIVGGAGWEVTKLAYVSVPLRVLVTYPHSVTDDADLLAGYSRLVEATGVVAHGQFLVAFASQDKPAVDGRVTSVAWRYYLYAGSDFLRLIPQQAGIAGSLLVQGGSEGI